MYSNGAIRRGGLALWDIISWTFGAALVIAFRYDFQITDVEFQAVLDYLVTAWVSLVVLGYLTKLYRGRFLVGSFDEVMGLGVHFALVAVATALVAQVLTPTLPRSLPVLAPPMGLLGAAAGRWFYRAMRDRMIPDAAIPREPVLIYGAGDAGRQVLQLIRNDRGFGLRVVGFVDDNPGKRHLRILGVPVLGDGSQLTDLAAEYDVGTIILAIPGASGRVVGDIQDRLQAAGLKFLLLPRVSELMGGSVRRDDIREVEISDVLGRHQVETSVNDIAAYITGRRVLITGAGGSIGAELARQVHRFGPSSLLLLDRDESALQAVQLSIYGHGLLDTEDTVLVDIRDQESLREVFVEHEPEIVFHAAALKHLPMLERYPREGWKTNVLGTLNLLELASEFGVDHFVNISTDKAADASSVLGATKRLAEQLTAWKAQETDRPYISVRFGNVLGSRGSMLHAFNAQIRAGGPVTVTHPEVTRYFMTIPEACELVVQAGAMGRRGEVLVLDMGTPVKILDVAKRMIAISGATGVDIVFTGLRPGEKLHETLFGEDEDASETAHPMIRSVQVQPLEPDRLTRTDLPDGSPESMTRRPYSPSSTTGHHSA